MVWNQPSKKSVNPACASTMTLLNPAMVTIPIQKLLRLLHAVHMIPVLYNTGPGIWNQ